LAAVSSSMRQPSSSVQLNIITAATLRVNRQQ
jgi:hypothetical protein